MVHDISEETMVVAKKKPPPKFLKPAASKNLQASYDAIPKAQVHKAARNGYSTNGDAMRKAVSRYMRKQKDAGLRVKKKFVISSHTSFFNSVKKVHKEKGREAAMAYVGKNVQTRIVFKGNGAKVVKPNNTLSLTRCHRNNKSVTIEAPRFHVSMDDIQWHIWLGNKVPLFVIKKSGIQNAGFGLFASQKFEEGDTVSM